MPLRPIVNKLEDVEEAQRGLYEPEMDSENKPTGRHIVSIVKEGGYELRNTTNLLNALAAEREQNKNLNSQLTKFEGIEPEKVTALTNELEQLKAANPDNKKIEELVEERVEPYKAEISRQLESYKSEAAKQLEEKDKVIAHRETQLRKNLVSDYANKVAGVVAISPALIAPHLERQLKADLDGDTARTVIIDDSGNPRLSSKDIQSPMTEAEWVDEIRKNPEFAPLIKGEGNPGTGSPQPNSKPNFNGAPAFSEAKSLDDKVAAIEARQAARGGG